MQDIQNGKPVEEITKVVTDISQSCNTALEIVNDFLLYDKIKSGKLLLESTPANIVHIVTDTLKPFYMQSRYKEITINVDMDIESKEDEDENDNNNNNNNNNSVRKGNNIHVDVHKFKQVLRNLFSNALKFTPKNGEITVRLKEKIGIINDQESVKHFVIEVVDTGAGISQRF
eukprot:gene13966-29728_t